MIPDSILAIADADSVVSEKNSHTFSQVVIVHIRTGKAVFVIKMGGASATNNAYDLKQPNRGDKESMLTSAYGCRDIYRSAKGFRKIMKNHLTAALIASITALAMPVANAAYTQADVTGTIGIVDPPGTLDRPGGFVSALAGYGSGGNPDPGLNPAAGFLFSPHIVEDTIVNYDVASAAAMFPSAGGTPFTATWSNGSAQLGKVSVAGRAEQVYDISNPTHGASFAHGGWVDNITITTPGNPALNGTQAIWLFEVDVAIAFDVSGYNGFADFELKPFVDRQGLSTLNPGYDGGTFNLSAGLTDQQSVWRLRLDSIGQQKADGIVDVATYAAEVTIGTPFDLGVFAIGFSGAATSDTHPTTGSIGEYDSDARWGGSAGLTTPGGTPLVGFQIDALSGGNWAQPIPLPGVG